MKNIYFILLITLLSSCSSLFHSTKNTLKKGLEKNPFDAIIVPGYPYTDTDTVWNNVHKIRVEWANYLYHKGYTKNIIFSGSAVYSPYVESKIMKLYAEQLDIPSKHIFTEESAEHSTENIYYAYRLAKKNGFKHIALATDPFQTNNLRRFIKRNKIPIDLLPIVFSTLAKQKRYNLVIEPVSAKRDNFVSLPERESFFERLSGTFGKKIIWHKEDVKRKRYIKKFRKQKRLIE